MPPGGRGQLVNFLLIGWWWGKWESASSTFWVQPVWGLCAYGQHIFNISHLVRVSIPAKQLQDIVRYIPWGGARNVPQGCLTVSWLVPPLSPHACSISQLCSTVTPWTAARQTPLPMGCSRQEYQSGLPFPSPGDHPDPGIEPMSPALAGAFFPTEPSGKHCLHVASAVTVHGLRSCGSPA